QQIIKQLEHPAKTGEVEPGQIALFYIDLGDNDQALAWLERAYAVRSVYMALLKAHPRFDPLHSDPRFADLLRRVGLPQ
nr:hypothetical protein [Acidobacteriota bacterium]